MLEQKIADLTVAVTELQRTIEALIASNEYKQRGVLETVSDVKETSLTGLEADTVIIDEPKVEEPKAEVKPAEPVWVPMEEPKAEVKPAEPVWVPMEEPKAEVKTDEKAEEPKTEAKSYTVEELRKMCIDAATAGKTQEVCDFLASKGVKKLTQLDAQYYNELADLLSK